ncbi:MAG: type II toxin-antitoxin system Phd/YefM family antitoxin [Chthonomonas sp.]|nr:type II toxin-antitoxin system Phd/YefM family antitoxin [Chthonomonas sp.]
MLHIDHIHPVTDFVRNYRTYLTRLKETGRPEVLTVNGVPECVLLDAKSYQAMQDALESMRFVHAVNEALAGMPANDGVPVAEGFQGIREHLDL